MNIVQIQTYIKLNQINSILSFYFCKYHSLFSTFTHHYLFTQKLLFEFQ